MAQDLRLRTKTFGLNVFALVQKMPVDNHTSILKKQLVRSATSIGANYRSSLRGRSKADFISKLSITLEEADETIYWLELLSAICIEHQTECLKMLKEANELTAIFTSSIITAKSKK